MPALGLAVGQTIGGFRLDEAVHVGGMASLWGVNALEGGPARVMKIPLPCYGEDPALVVSARKAAGVGRLLRPADRLHP